jgi:hypothetical protein
MLSPVTRAGDDPDSVAPVQSPRGEIVTLVVGTPLWRQATRTERINNNEERLLTSSIHMCERCVTTVP